MKINRTLTKDYILENVDEIDIFSEYLAIDDREIEICIDDGLLMCSPLRSDDNPTVGFKYNAKGRLKMRDFAGYFWGDCFDVIAHLYDLNVNNKEDFYKILYDIAVRFGLIKDSTYKEYTIAVTKKRIKRIREHTKHVIDIKIREWNRADKLYWKKIFKYENRTTKYLDFFKVYAIENYWIDIDSQPAPKYYYKANDPCYAYYFGKDENGIRDIKLYFPLRDRKSPYLKFITNSDNVGGLDYLPQDMDYAIITKSYKDFMSMYSFVATYNPKVGVASLASESTSLSLEEYNYIASRVKAKIRNSDRKAIFTLLDFDRTGVVMSNKMRKDYKTLPFFLTDGRFKTIDYEGKDFTDTIVEKGKDYIDNLVVRTMVEINKMIKHE